MIKKLTRDNINGCINRYAALIQCILVTLCAMLTSCSSPVHGTHKQHRGLWQDPQMVHIIEKSQQKNALPSIDEYKRYFSPGLTSLRWDVGGTNKIGIIENAFQYEIELGYKPLDKYSLLAVSSAELGVIHFPCTGAVDVKIREATEYDLWLNATFRDNLLRSYELGATTFTSIFALQAGLDSGTRATMHTNAATLMNNWYDTSAVISNTYGAFAVIQRDRRSLIGVVAKDGTFTKAIVDQNDNSRVMASFSQNGVDFSLYCKTNGTFDAIYEHVCQANGERLVHAGANSHVVYRNMVNGKCYDNSGNEVACTTGECKSKMRE